MTDRLSDIEARIDTAHQLSAVITAMRGIAAARAREGRGHVDAIRAYTGMIASAIGQVLAFLPQSGRPSPALPGSGAHAIIAVCAEQGFAGAFSERVLDAAKQTAGASPQQRMELLIVGDRGLLLASERGLDVAWSTPTITHAGQMAALAGRILEALYQRLDAGRVSRVTVVHAVPNPAASIEIAQKRLVPFDFGRFPPAPAAVAPLITLKPSVLLAKLVEEYVFAALCEAVMLSFAAENEARMRAMIAARSNVAKTLDGLIARSRQLRQEGITDEIIELVGGAAARPDAASAAT